MDGRPPRGETAKGDPACNPRARRWPFTFELRTGSEPTSGEEDLGGRERAGGSPSSSRFRESELVSGRCNRDRPRGGSYSRGVPCTSPKAKVSAVISISTSARAGTLTATGTKKQPHELPGNTALASSVPLSRSRTRNSGLSPMGCQPTYRSPAAP